MNALTKVFAVLFSVAMLFACGGGGEDVPIQAEKAVMATGMKKILSTNKCSDGDVPDALLGRYLPSSQLETSVREWAAVRGYLYVSGKTIVASFTFDEAAINTFRLRSDFAFEIDVVDLDDILVGGWKFTAEFGDATIKRDISILDAHHQLSLIVLNPHLLVKGREYKVRFDLDQPIQSRGRLKLNTDLSVSFSGSVSPLCINPFFRPHEPTYPGNYFKLEIEQYSAFWYTPNTSVGVCWTDQKTSGFGECVSPRGTELASGNLTLSPDEAGDVGLLGVGIQALVADEPAPEPPDFIGKRSWLETPWGVETYKYGRTETVKMKGKFKNEGDGPCKDGESSVIIVHAYRSRGYNEDVHSGAGAWKRVGTDEIQCANLQPGDTNTETEGLVLSGLDLGIHNVVWCIDHPRDDHNNGGDHVEKHEGNNCTTPAVFELVEGTVNVPNTDLITMGLTFLQAPVYAGDPARIGVWLKNQGTVNAIADTRLSYTVSCNGGPTTILTDDGTMATTMVAGASAWEETIAPVMMPNVTGTCVVTATADYLGAQPETDEGNNSTSITVTLAPRPAPNLVITWIKDEVGCCTTNTGSRIRPKIWVQNVGSVAPASSVTVIYHISSPLATGGAYIHIGYGSIRPDELPPGKNDEDGMDGNGWQIPKSNAWKKQGHTIRGCIKADGSTPIGGGPGEICDTYWRYSKK